MLCRWSKPRRQRCYILRRVTYSGKVQVNFERVSSVNKVEDFYIQFINEPVFFTPHTPNPKEQIRLGEVNRIGGNAARVVTDKIFDTHWAYKAFYSRYNGFLVRDLPRTELGVFGQPIIEYPIDNHDPMVFEVMGLVSHSIPVSYMNAYMGMIIAHELGHLLGLKHTDCDINSSKPQLMSGQLNSSLDYEVPAESARRAIDNIPQKTEETIDTYEDEIWNLE